MGFDSVHLTEFLCFTTALKDALSKHASWTKSTYSKVVDIGLKVFLSIKLSTGSESAHTYGIMYIKLYYPLPNYQDSPDNTLWWVAGGMRRII